MMKILALEKEIPGHIPEDFTPYLKDEAYRVWELYQASIIRKIYFRQERHEAVLLLEYESPTEADEILSALPLVQQELIRFELIPLIPYPGFARLFVPEQETSQSKRESENGH